MHFDIHIHSTITSKPNPENLLSKLHDAGFDGGVVISPAPFDLKDGRRINNSSTVRLESLLAWTSGHPTLFPFFWIDPTAKDALKQVEQAAANGVVGFKVICSEHAPDDPRAMPVYQAIAALNKPILFHSGILWDGLVSSHFNRPAAFEALLDVPRLRFALAHMSWPWLDECLAVYGKFLNATLMRPDAPEMFIDLTPGTPVIYREEALTKLFTVGYDVAHNVMFGTDTLAGDYNSAWSREWRDRDLSIMRKLKLGEEVERNYLEGNLQQWLNGQTHGRHPPKSGV